MSNVPRHANPSLPDLGFGLGLRTQHYQAILEQRPAVDWFEALTENYLVPGGKPLYHLEQVRAHYPVVLHGVSLSIGAADALNREYLAQLKALASRIEPVWISDHLCWTGLNGNNLHDLLPLPYTEEAVRHVSERILQVQEFLGRRLLIENVSSYVTYTDSRMSEWEFLSAVVERADCLMLLDVNNIYVSAFNHDFDALDYLNGVPAGRVQQMHLAGHRNHGEYIIDTHDEPIIDPVWALYAEARRRFGPVSTMIERDDNIPPLGDLLMELDQARRIAADVDETRLVAGDAA
jgi:uncharacterized protein (UPF0276 family)